MNRNNSREGGRPSSRAWTPPGNTVNDKRDLEPAPLGPRSSSPKPSGRIAIPDSQLASSSMGPPIFNSPYNRDLYQRFGLSRPESSMKPSSTSFSSGGSRKSDLPSPGGRDAHYTKFSPHRDRDRDEYELGSGPSTKSPGTDHARERSPHASLQRPSSSDQFDLKPRQMTSDSTTEKGNSPGEGRRYPEDDTDRNGRRSHDHVKMERGSPEPRSRTFSGDFTRESLSRLSQASRDSSRSDIAAQGESLTSIN